jgi:predicted  nucleic acid-binding Zn-ribbon protein
MLANGEAALAAWEKRLREQAERLDRERAGHGQASQEAFALLAELEQREEGVRALESKVLAAEARNAERSEELATMAEELRRREACLGVDLVIREDRLDERERSVAERERCLVDRERDLGAYVGQLQDQFSDRSVA